MKARAVAATLIAAGFRVRSVTEGNDVEDGIVEITARVHVQVPTYGNLPNVVRENDDGSFMFYSPCQSIVTLTADIRKALGVDPSSDNTTRH